MNIQSAIDKAYPKFDPNEPNLLVVNGEGLFSGFRHGVDWYGNDALLHRDLFQDK